MQPVPAGNVYSRFTALALSTGAVNLGQGFPDDPAPASLIAAATRAIEQGHNQYPPSYGVPELRAAVARHQQDWYGVDLDPDTQVVATAGASEALTAALLAFVHPGDEVLIIDPAYDHYPAAVELARAIGVRVRGVSELAAHVTGRTRAVMLNSPGNPSGLMLTREELHSVGQLAADHDLVVISDEVYEHVVIDDVEHVCALEEPLLADRTVVISSAAKTFCVTDWKIGWATGPADLVRRVHDVKQFLSFASGTPFQLAVAEALAEPQEHIAGLRAAYRERREILTACLERAGYDVSRPAGGYFVMADAAGLGVHDTAALQRHCEELPGRVGVVGIPGSTYTQGDDVTWVRFCFAKSRDRIDEAVRRLDRSASGR